VDRDGLELIVRVPTPDERQAHEAMLARIRKESETVLWDGPEATPGVVDEV
jgi:predicted dienelactone hydrolase